MHRAVAFLALGLAGVLAAPALPFAANPQEIGVYFTQVNTYIYPEGPERGKRILLRPRNAYPVVDFTLDRTERVWYRISYTGQQEALSGVGWTPNAPHRLVSEEQNSVMVYSKVLTKSSYGFTGLRIPISDIELLNETQPSTVFSQIDWQKVRYETRASSYYWARAGAGIYRANKTEDFLTSAYNEMVTRNVNKDTLQRLLSGIVRIGDSPTEVKWALGEPLRTQDETVGEATRATWQFPEIVVLFENSVVKQIN